ncbi:hypothetical protein CALVIDRAFT_563470 [Calocera viscosa TUFC12733]|uniref:Uncharacterized protein n=1 Tax=Calocera viscosa (strain TUFC12733) TaxID=1330018 RepID=A0A167MKS3_CALVF|nr:hypothetical protein CALVIDRAFT_563470 [Calocera viscosa TUFC12733]
MPSPKSPKREAPPPLLPQHALPTPSKRVSLSRLHPRLPLLSRAAATARDWRTFYWPGDATPLLVLMTFTLWACVLVISSGLDMGKNVVLVWVGSLLSPIAA